MERRQLCWQGGQWVVSFAGWYNHRHRYSGIKFVTPQQSNSAQAVEICIHRAVVYEQASQRNTRHRIRTNTLLASLRSGLNQSTTYKT